jgi:O-antigen/teichoic acid export membrane protein
VGSGPATVSIDVGRAGRFPDAEAHDVSDLSTLARGGIVNLAGVAVTAVAGFTLVVVVTRGLNRTQAGIFFEAVALFSILGAIAQWGADIGVVRAIPRLRVLGRRLDIPRTVWAGVLPALAVGSLLASLVWVFADQLGTLLTNGAHGSDLSPAFRALAPFLPVYAAFMVGLGATRGFGTMVPSTVIDRLGRASAQLVLVVGAIALGLSSFGLAFVWGLPFALGCVAIMVWLLSQIRTELADNVSRSEGRSFWMVFKGFWRFTAPRGLATVFAVTVLWLSTLLLGALRSPAEAAGYAAATRFLVLGQFIIAAITQVVAPQLSELLARNERERARAVYATATWWLMALVWPLYVFLIVLAPSLLSVFGEGYRQSATALVILGSAMLLATAIGPVDMVLLMAGRSIWNLANTLVAVVVNVGLNLLLIPPLGLTGAAIAWAASIVLNNTLPLAQVWRFVGLQPFGRGSLVSGTSAIAWFGGAGLLCWSLLGDGLGTVVVAGTVGAAGHAVTLWRFRDVLHLDVLRRSIRRPDPTSTTG